MDKKLKPCTTCGWDQPVISISEYHDGKKSIKDLFAVICNNCGAKSGNWTRKKDAIQAWNHKYEIMVSTIEVLTNKITKTQERIIGK